MLDGVAQSAPSAFSWGNVTFDDIKIFEAQKKSAKVLPTNTGTVSDIASKTCGVLCDPGKDRETLPTGSQRVQTV